MLWIEKNRPRPFSFSRREFLRATAALPAAYAFPFGDYLGINKPQAGYYDVVIYGGTISGINAAYCAAMLGCKVALLCQDSVLGGMSGNGGLTNIDMSFRPTQIGGVFWHQFQACNAAELGSMPSGNAIWPARFDQFTASASSTAAGYIYPSTIPGNTGAMWMPQPATLRTVLEATAAGWLPPNPPVSGINVFMSCALQTYAGSVYPAVAMWDGTVTAGIKSLTTNLGVFTGAVFIDASYEGDVMAAVSRNSGGCSYAIGRESTSAYSETNAGVSPAAATSVAGAAFGSGNTTYPLIANPNRTTGAADGAIQRYCYRVPLQKVANGGVAFIQPSGYDATRYALVALQATNASKTTLAGVMTIYASLGTGKNSSNEGASGVLLGMDNQSLSYPDGTPTARAAIALDHQQWWQGLFYFLQTDSSVPAAVRTDTALYGIDRSAYPNNVVNDYPYWPGQLYIREGRRGCDSSSDATGGHKGSVGKFQILRQQDMLNSVTWPHPVAMPVYILDLHSPLTYYSDATHYVLDGDLFISSGYGSGTQIPMECMIPAAGGCPNLITSVCHGSSHVAWAVMRMEPTFAMMGEAAGMMGAIVSKGIGGPTSSVQSITYSSQLLPLLKSIGARLS